MRSLRAQVSGIAPRRQGFVTAGNHPLSPSPVAWYHWLLLAGVAWVVEPQGGVPAESLPLEAYHALAVGCHHVRAPGSRGLGRRRYRAALHRVPRRLDTPPRRRG